MEKSIGAFPFLDVQININENILETRIWRKPTHTGVLLNFSAACPKQWITGLIICLLKRAKTICSTDNIFWTEVKNLRFMFRANGYPNWIFDRCVKKFLKLRHLRQLYGNGSSFLLKYFDWFGSVWSYTRHFGWTLIWKLPTTAALNIYYDNFRKLFRPFVQRLTTLFHLPDRMCWHNLLVSIQTFNDSKSQRKR